MNTKEAIMDTKKAIEILSKVNTYGSLECDLTEAMVELDTLEAGDIIALLKRGEKFEQMWGKYKKKSPPIMIDNVKNCSKNINDFIKQAKIMRIKAMQDLEQKYFPKEVSHETKAKRS